MTGEKEPNQSQIGMWQALQNVTIHALDRGQLLQVGLLAIIGILVFKLDAKDAAGVLNELFQMFRNLATLGWVIGVLTLVGWYSHVKWIRNATKKEFTRLADERNELQQRLTESQLNSSRPKLSQNKIAKP